MDWECFDDLPRLLLNSDATTGRHSSSALLVMFRVVCKFWDSYNAGSARFATAFAIVASFGGFCILLRVVCSYRALAEIILIASLFLEAALKGDRGDFSTGS